MADLDGPSFNVAGVRELVNSKTNKIAGQVTGEDEGALDETIDELDLPMTDEELLDLAEQWDNRYKEYELKVKTRQENNKKYYLGKQLEGTQYATEFPIAANLLFEAEETFLPAALSKNPEPVVWSASNDQVGTALANDTKTMLQYHADVLVLRQKLTIMTRHWSIYFLGILKHGWDEKLKDIKTEVRNPQNFIFDPEGYVDVYGDFQGYLGERITRPASKLVEEFPKHAEHIKTIAKNKMGTPITYTEWWTDDFYFCTLRGKVLDKAKNPHFLYNTEETGKRNHFGSPKKPYTFLSVFSLEEQPHDITGLIEQNIPNQNLIAKRTMQIDVNLSRQNNSVAFSADNFNQQTAKQAAQAFEKGNPVLVPSGRPIAEAITRFPAERYPDSAFTELETNKNNLRASFGTQGITAQQQDEDQTARGMILNQQRDSTRIGGGIGDRIEQVADNTFNWWVQLYHVYYDDTHEAPILGPSKSLQYATLNNSSFKVRLVISVASGSMLPKDEISQANQAISLAEAGLLDPETLFKTLNIPDTDNALRRTVLWQVNKQAYLQIFMPEITGQSMGGPGAGNPPNTSGEIQPTPQNISAEPASAALSNVPLPPIGQPTA